MSGIQPFQFEPTYSPGEEPSEDDFFHQDEQDEPDSSARIGNTNWCMCGVCVAMPSADECYCCQELEELNQKFDDTGLWSFLFFHPLYLYNTTVVSFQSGLTVLPIVVLFLAKLFDCFRLKTLLNDYASINSKHQHPPPGQTPGI